MDEQKPEEPTTPAGKLLALAKAILTQQDKVKTIFAQTQVKYPGVPMTAQEAEKYCLSDRRRRRAWLRDNDRVFAARVGMLEQMTAAPKG